MDLRTPFVAESGGAVVVPENYFDHKIPGSETRDGYEVLPLGVPRSDLSSALAEMAARIGARVRGFASLGLSEIQRFTGLNGAGARFALEREHDEPFVVEDEASIAALAEVARERRLEVRRGRRFFHLSGGSDKGRAARVLMGLFEAAGRRLFSVGLGGAPNDLAMLTAVRQPIVIPRPDGTADPAIAEALPGAEIAPRPGPAGWNDAVLAVLRGERLESANPRFCLATPVAPSPAAVRASREA
jgi:mannosyl-3-phosphoglycerate phosphatase